MKKIRKFKLNKFNIYLLINSIVLAFVSILTIVLLKNYDILPFKYMLLLSIGLILIPGLLIFFMLKKKTKKIIKVILSIFSIIVITILAIILVYLQKTFKFLDNLKDDGYFVKNYSVIVLNSSKYNKIEDLEDRNIDYYFNSKKDKNSVLNELNKKVSLNSIEVNGYDELVNDLYDKKVDAILLEESYIGIIEENNVDFSVDTKVIYTIEIKSKSKTIVKEVDVKEETFNIYISGIDTYGNISSVSRSDVNIIATINPNTKQILLTTIPRDYYVQLDGTTGYKDKLTHAGIYGIDKSIKTLENLLDIDINYYFKVNFSSLEKIVDALDGVDVYSEYTFVGFEGTQYVKGYNRVNGQQALQFARTRKTIDGGDRTRGKNQQALIQAILKKACSKDIIVKYPTILNSLSDSFQTNMSTDKLTSLIKKQIDDMTPWNVTSIGLDGTNGSEYTYSYGNQKLYVMIPDEETIENAKDMIKQVSRGKVFDSSYDSNENVVSTPKKYTSNQTQQKNEEKPVESSEKTSNTTTNSNNSSVEKDNSSVNTDTDKTTKDNETSIEEESNSIEKNNNVSSDTSEEENKQDNTNAVTDAKDETSNESEQSNTTNESTEE